MAAATYLQPSEISSDKMDPSTSLPLSPTASSDAGQLPQGFDELVHHNNATSYPREHLSMEMTSFRSASEHPDSRMSTPAPPHAAMSPNFTEYGFPPPPQLQQPVHANDYTYQNQPVYDNHDGVYPSLPDDPPYTTPASSPSQRSDMLSLRNGAVSRPAAVIRPTAAKSRVQKPKRKKGRDKADKDKVILEKPLSEMGEEWKQSMIEIEAYINRPAEARTNEINSDRKQPGRVKRPMNSFMLYRKAFQNHTKAYCEHNNHQVVSKVCGASWDMEPEHIRKQFADWAKLERANHQKAHPGYKFAPAKPSKNPKRKRDSDDELSDLESFDWESGQRIKRLHRSHTGTPIPEHDMYAPQQGYYHQPPPPPPQYSQHHAMMTSRNAILSSYPYSNPNKPVPTPYSSLNMGQPGQYLASTSMSNHHYQQRGYGAVEDISYHKTPSPGNTYHQSMQAGLLDSYVSTPQHHGLDHTPPPTQYMQDGRIEHGLYQPVNDNSFDPSDPLHLPDHAIETGGLDFNYGHHAAAQQPISDGLSHDFGGENLLHDQQAQQLLRGNDESWEIQQLDEGQSGEQYDDWGVDPSLSEPYAINDPSLSEAYTAQD